MHKTIHWNLFDFSNTARLYNTHNNVNDTCLTSAIL